jgi:hypothetical protein
MSNAPDNGSNPAHCPATALGKKTLTSQDLADVVFYLDRALKVFERAQRPFTAAELSTRTMLSVLKSEVEIHLQRERSGTKSREQW